MKKLKTARLAALLGLACLSLFLVACEQKSINEIMANPHRYTRHQVGVVGRVVQSYSVLGRGAYQIDDGTGKLWVVSVGDKGVPRKGARVAVKGKIRDGFDLGSIVKLPEAVSSGLVLEESSLKAKN
ncbi:MAG: hypothetical protein DMG06_11845 [Acidobacteria bacterium]|nr:MAG: hypothetical protein DMG06_11845 [Acidobacteriota bacterium]